MRQTTQNCKLQVANCKLQIDRAEPPHSANLQFGICNLQFAFGLSPLLAFSASRIWNQVTDAVGSAAMGEQRLIQVACIVVIVGIFFLMWRK
jgi:hypothetical protein